MSKLSKKCPVCRCENAVSDFFCQHCGIDISSVPAGLPQNVKSSLPDNAVKSRTCPQCGNASDTIFPLCANCGFDFAAAPKSKLWLVIGSESHECKNGDVIGREGTVARNFFSNIGTVSRKHATFSHKDGRWFITVAASVQNISQLDGTELPRGIEHPLSGEHILKLSTQCEVRLRLATES